MRTVEQQAFSPMDAQTDNAGTVIYFTAQDGARLAARVFGSFQPGRLPVLCLPGLARNSRDFAGLGHFLAEQNQPSRQVFAVDYRGRGLSAPAESWTQYSPLLEARDVLTASEALGIHKAVVVGTSRGGLIAMVLGALRPGLMAGVVLNDIGPVIEGTGLARIKGYLSNPAAPRDLDDAVERLKKIMAAQFTALTDEDWRALARAVYAEDDKGRLHLDVEPGLLKSVASIDLEHAVPTLWPQFESLREHPVLSIRGENSDILSENTVKAMVERHPHLETLTVAGQGHAPLLRDGVTLNRISAFAQRCDANWH